MHNEILNQLLVTLGLSHWWLEAPLSAQLGTRMHNWSRYEITFLFIIVQTTNGRKLCFAPFPFEYSELPGRERVAMFPISWSGAATVCLQSTSCENAEFKWYMCGLTCTAQESLGWITLFVFVHWTIMSPEGGVPVSGLGWTYGTTLLPTHLSPWVVAPRISGLECHLLLTTILLHFIAQLWFFLYSVYTACSTVVCY